MCQIFMAYTHTHAATYTYAYTHTYTDTYTDTHIFLDEGKKR